MGLFKQWLEGKKSETGFFSTDKTYIKFSFLNIHKPVVVTFSMMGAYVEENKKNIENPVWGYDYIVNKGLNCISFCCIGEDNWYIDDGLRKYLSIISEALEVFPERLGYGGSMGGVGVLLYANVLKVDRVLVMNPISTLSEDLVSFEKRFKRARNELDWNGQGKDGSVCEADGYVVYDPLFEPDKLHAKRLRLRELKFHGVGHFMPVHLKSLGILNWLFDAFIEGEVDEKKFYKLTRKKREYFRYYNWLLSIENKYLTPRRALIIRMYRDFYLIKKGKKEAVTKKSIDNLRDFALSLERDHIDKAFLAMTIAKEMRPHGPLISSKVKYYRHRLDT